MSATSQRSIAPSSSRSAPLTHRELIARLQRQIRSVLAPCAPRGRYALVDFPAHSNVGDSAIWLGALRALQEICGTGPAYVAKAQDFDAQACRAAIGEEGTIFINGGGNFGDVWAMHQVFLRELLVVFPGHPIVQLPQSIHFRDPANFAATAQAVARHPEFTLLVRDRTSLALAERFDCPSRLCCDLAVYLGPQPRPREPDVDVLCLMRTDRERAVTETLSPIAGRRDVVDWLDESLPAVRARRLLALAAAAARGDVHRQALQRVSFAAAARARVRRGLRLLARGRVVVTDRLHAHVLAVLLGLPHAVLDNSYGKLSAFVDCWTRECPRFAARTALAPALQWAEEQAGRSATAPAARVGAAAGRPR